MSSKVNASNNVPLFMGKTASDLIIESSELSQRPKITTGERLSRKFGFHAQQTFTTSPNAQHFIRESGKMSTKVSDPNNVPLFMGKTASDLGIETSEFIGSHVAITSDNGCYQGQVQSVHSTLYSTPYSECITKKEPLYSEGHPWHPGFGSSDSQGVRFACRHEDHHGLESPIVNRLIQSTVHPYGDVSGTQKQALRNTKLEPVWRRGFGSSPIQGVIPNERVHGFASHRQVHQSNNNSVHPVAGGSGTQKRRNAKLKKQAPSQMTADDMAQPDQKDKPRWTQRGNGFYTESESDDSNENGDNENLNEREKTQHTKAEIEKNRVVESGEEAWIELTNLKLSHTSSAEQLQSDTAARVEDEVSSGQNNLAEKRAGQRNTRRMLSSNFGRRFGTKKPSRNVTSKFTNAVSTPMTAGVMGQLDKELSTKWSRHRAAVYSESEDEKENHDNEELNEALADQIQPDLTIPAENEKPYKRKTRRKTRGQVRAESEQYILKLKQRIAELEDKVRLLESRESTPKASSGERVMVGHDSVLQVYPDASGSQSDTYHTLPSKSSMSLDTKQFRSEISASDYMRQIFQAAKKDFDESMQKINNKSS